MNSNKEHILKESGTKNYFIFHFKNILRHSGCWTMRFCRKMASSQNISGLLPASKYTIKLITDSYIYDY